MAWNNLKQTVAAYVKENGNNEITGDGLQVILKDMIDALGAYFSFVGVAVPTTTPVSSPDGRVFYLASQNGLYSSFGAINLSDELAALVWKGTSWQKIQVCSLIGGGGTQVQSDWAESDTTDPAYIKNKPTIPVVNNPVVEIKQGGVTKATFTLNQQAGTVVNLDGAPTLHLLHTELSADKVCTGGQDETVLSLNITKAGLYQINVLATLGTILSSGYEATFALAINSDKRPIYVGGIGRSERTYSMSVVAELSAGDTLILVASSQQSSYTILKSETFAGVATPCTYLNAVNLN